MGNRDSEQKGVGLAAVEWGMCQEFLCSQWDEDFWLNVSEPNKIHDVVPNLTHQECAEGGKTCCPQKHFVNIQFNGNTLCLFRLFFWQVMAGDFASFGGVSFVVGYNPDLFHIIVIVWWLQVLVWLGIFWLFSVTEISGKMKMFQTKSHRIRQIWARGPSTPWCDFLFFTAVFQTVDETCPCACRNTEQFFFWLRLNSDLSRLFIFCEQNRFFIPDTGGYSVSWDAQYKSQSNNQ